MRREPHVRFCERAVVKFRRATHLTHLDRVHPLGQAGIAVDIGEQDGNDSGDVLLLLDAAEGTFGILCKYSGSFCFA